MSPAFGALPLAGVVATFRVQLAASLGVDADRFDHRGVSVRSDDGASPVATVHGVGPHQVVRCDARRAAALGLDEDPVTALVRLGAEVVANETIHVVAPTGLRHPPLPPGLLLHPIAGSTAGLADHPRRPVAVVDGVGASAPLGVAGYHPATGLAPGFGAIGVHVRPDARRRGVGAALVAAVADRMAADGYHPLLRGGADDEATRSLAAALGFRPVCRVTTLHADPSP